MRYTQSQIRELLSISVDAFRTWREAIPALTEHKGHAPSFTPGDVVAMAIVAELVRDFGVRVGTMGDRFNLLFKECRGKSWLSLEDCVALIDAESLRLVEISLMRLHSSESTRICILCAPIIARLRSTLTATGYDQIQGHLPFPPTSLAIRQEQRGKRA